MIKKIFFVLIIGLTFLCCGCVKSVRSESRISGVSEDLFYGEEENFNLSLYPEMREFPYEKDGFKGELKTTLVFKLISAVGMTYNQTPKIKFTIKDKTYEGEFEFRPVSFTLLCAMETNDLPNGDLDVVLTVNGVEKCVKLSSLKNNRCISYKDIIKNLKNYDNKGVAEFLASPSDHELRIRLLEDGGYNYWYFSIIRKDNAYDLLFDAETGELIAEKQDKN